MGLLLPIATSVVRRFNFIMSVNLPKGGMGIFSVGWIQFYNVCKSP